jgi:hypothetical protein
MPHPTDPAATAPIAPIASKPLCDLLGCGMPAVASDRGLNHCDHHRGWAKSKEADALRAQKGTG